MKRILGGILVLASLWMVQGCATSYHAGYSEKQRRENLFDVSFRGNQHTPAPLAYMYAKRRSAELTLAHHFSHFLIVDEKEDHFSYKEKYSHKIGKKTYYKTEKTTWPHVILTITMLDPQQAKVNSNAINAQEFLENNPITGLVLDDLAWQRLELELQLPENILKQLEPLKNEPFSDSEDFAFAIKKALGPENHAKYGADVFKSAEKYPLYQFFFKP